MEKIIYFYVIFALMSFLMINVAVYMIVNINFATNVSKIILLAVCSKTNLKKNKFYVQMEIAKNQLIQILFNRG